MCRVNISLVTYIGLPVVRKHLNEGISVFTRDVNRAEISGPARKIFFSARPGPQSMYYKILTTIFFEILL